MDIWLLQSAVLKFIGTTSELFSRPFERNLADFAASVLRWKPLIDKDLMISHFCKFGSVNVEIRISLGLGDCKVAGGWNY